MDDLRVQTGLEGVELVALGFDEAGGGRDAVGFGGAVGRYCLFTLLEKDIIPEAVYTPWSLHVGL